MNDYEVDPEMWKALEKKVVEAIENRTFDREHFIQFIESMLPFEGSKLSEQQKELMQLLIDTSKEVAQQRLIAVSNPRKGSIWDKESDINGFLSSLSASEKANFTVWSLEDIWPPSLFNNCDDNTEIDGTLADLPGKRKHKINAAKNFTYPEARRKRGMPGRG